MNFIVRNIKRLGYAFSGVYYALRNDFSYRTQVYWGGAILSCFSVIFWPLNQTEFLFLLLGWILILITELQNSSFESALDRIHPEMHDSIGRSKDMAAGAVLTAAGFLGVVLLTIMYNRFEYLLPW